MILKKILISLCAAIVLPIFMLSAAAHAKDLIGIYSGWAAFLESGEKQCYAIAQPTEVVGRDSQKGNSSFIIGFWPERGQNYQIYVRFSRERSTNSAVTLSAGGRRFRLDGNRTEAWAKDKRMDLAIVAAVRSSASLSIESIGRDGRAIVDAYKLRGAASAIDAAALACK